MGGTGIHMHIAIETLYLSNNSGMLNLQLPALLVQFECLSASFPGLKPTHSPTLSNGVA